MRKTIAVLLVTAFLGNSAALLRRDRDRGGDFNPMKYIKKIVRILLPLDDSGIGPPKP
ncbi:MAG TPA: hypothetical protein VII12_09830 [Thermoanaerobaculia bacterium]|jgi:hypothetical protein|nr:hypothetical protein [Thermoanaerobaculia bacterium]